MRVSRLSFGPMVRKGQPEKWDHGPILRVNLHLSLAFTGEKQTMQLETQVETPTPDRPGRSSATDEAAVLRPLYSAAAELDSVNATLQNIACEVGNRLAVDVCSIYLFERDSDSLVLAATVGLCQSCIGNLRMGLHEGLAGLVAQHRSPLAVEEAAKHPRFRYFPEALEDDFTSFLGVPLVDGNDLLGVLVVQTYAPRRFDDDEIEHLVQVAATYRQVIAEVGRQTRSA